MSECVERRFVETVARRGYRFLADVAVIDSADRQGEPTPNPPSHRNTASVDRANAGAPSKHALHSYIRWSFAFGLALVARFNQFERI